ncbi:hypothetical protein EI613_05585 [Azospirillum sp. 412522]|nr:hypothetical protein [Azospirillum sp. 412522]MBY6261402.1 hypothetical protein [Azospirillum sp. 412522]
MRLHSFFHRKKAIIAAALTSLLFAPVIYDQLMSESLAASIDVSPESPNIAPINPDAIPVNVFNCVEKSVEVEFKRTSGTYGTKRIIGSHISIEYKGCTEYCEIEIQTSGTDPFTMDVSGGDRIIIVRDNDRRQFVARKIDPLSQAVCK